MRMNDCRLLSDVDLLARLIASDSTSTRSNRPIADFVADYIAAAGGSVELLADATGEKANVLAWAGAPAYSKERRGLLLSGHLDVVPAGEPEWKTNPFEMAIADGRLIGRGATDMKGFVALAVNHIARAAAGRPARPLCLLLTHDEEVGSLGAQRFAREYPRLGELPRSVLVGEPTEFAVVRMHKGHLRLRVTARGRSAHSGLPHLGENAIEAATDALAALRDLAATMRAVRTDTSAHFPECPFPVLNIGTIHGGSAVNIVPDECVIDLGVRLLPGQSSEEWVQRVGTVLAATQAATRGVLRWELRNDSPPMLCGEEAAIHRELCALVGQRDSLGVSYASDAGTLSRHGFDCVLWGPGSMDQAHRPNESLAQADLVRGGELLDRAIERLMTSDD